MKAGVVHCRCSKCYSAPARKRVRKRTEAQTLLSLPEEVHSRLRDIVDAHSSVWARCDEGQADVCGRRASHFFSLAETLHPAATEPFTWVFIRPPWSLVGSCCKAVVFNRLKAECETSVKKGPLLHSLARVLLFFDAGCLQSSYLLWEQNCKAAMTDPGRYLQCVRTLRDYAAKGSWEAQLSLAKVCVGSNPLGLEGKACADQVAQFFGASRPRHGTAGDILKRGIKDTMRYILVDWLVEVTTMKALSSLTLQVTVGCVDRYLARRSAVWLTDNTYKYEDLVRMMGEVVSVLQGQIRTPTLLDYGEVLLHLLPLAWRTTHLFKYVCELSLLHSTFAAAPPAKLACGVLLLARALQRYDLSSYALQLYVKCFSPDVPKDYRHVSLTAVLCFWELCQILELSEAVLPEDPPSPSGSGGDPADIHTFLSSPSSNNKRRRDDGMPADRGTPTAELSTQEETLLGDMLDWSLDASCSGYEGDREESEAERDGETSVMTINLHTWSVGSGPDHCRSLSSDENSFCESESGGEGEEEAMSVDRQGPGWTRRKSRAPLPSSSSAAAELPSSGYASIHRCSTSSSSPACSFSPLVPCAVRDLPIGGAADAASATPGFRLLVPALQRTGGGSPSSTSSSSCKQVKRKNGAAHSGGEMKSEEEEEAVAMEEDGKARLQGL
ncbi:hypothetical protein CRUP_037405 [Coryphaenoides rupestris]|nr:hypothetical protein CRUP_037405 [Coryphaenoides rupestris]